MINLIKDPTFANGFQLLRRSLNENNQTDLMYLPYSNLRTPSYRLAEYFTKHELWNEREIITGKDSYIIKNKTKEIIRDEKGRLTLTVFGKDEYDHLRKFNEPWPHLLIEQQYKDEWLKNIKELTVEMDLDYLMLESFINEDRSDLHTLQVSLYFAIGDNNPNSKGYKDFYWFGLPMIDAPRLRFPKPYCSKDIGKEDATNKLIYSIDPHIFMKDVFNVGDRLSFTLKIKDYLLEGFKVAKDLGYLPYTKLEDLSIFSFNFGYEMTGAFSGKIRINKFNIWKEEDHE